MLLCCLIHEDANKAKINEANWWLIALRRKSDKNVARFDIAMNEAESVEEFEGTENMLRNSQSS
jgi:hypothetical protein